LPYYVASRSIKSITQIKTIAFSIITVAIVISLIAVFEHFKGWLLYRSITGILGYIGDDQLLLRSGSVRSIATLLQPIVLGYFMCIALGVYLFAERYIISKNMRRAGYFILVLGLYVPVSRGPWVGAALMILVFISLGPSALKKIATIAFISVLLIPTLSIVPGGEKYLDLIPFVGKTEESTITYRQNLYTNSMAVIERNPLFGSTNYILEPEMQALKVNGLIDIVNSYIQIALESGYIGLLFFVGAFVFAIKSTLKQLKRIKDKNNEFSALLRSIIAIIFGILATIATVSSIGVVSIFYWLMLGICIACCEMIKNELDKEIKVI
jgi:O-antigen ligase